jgi:CRISPR system Cascade subunit CasA
MRQYLINLTQQIQQGRCEMPNFSLLESPWLPVRMNGGQVLNLGLAEVFERSKDIESLADTSPTDVIAQYRLLLAILHRAATLNAPGWGLSNRLEWFEEGLPLSAIQQYLSDFRDRFWLFHPEVPFLQVAALATAEETRDKRKAWTQISLPAANGNTPLVFDHALDAAPSALGLPEAVRTLLGFLQFTPGGLVKTFRDADKAGPLVNTAATVALGATLAQTLCLNLHPPGRKQGMADLPSWEQPPLTIAQLKGAPVLATGPNDRYSRQTRAVLFLQEPDMRIRWIHFGAGYALGDDENELDPMTTYRQGSANLVKLTFSDARALWRDLPALAMPPGASGKPPAVLNQAVQLGLELGDGGPVYQPVLIAGLASDQAKLLRWRMERFALPSTLLQRPELATFFKNLVEKSEVVFKALNSVAVKLVAHTMPDPESSETRKRARAYLESGAWGNTYFAHMERALQALLDAIGRCHVDQAQTQWHAAIREASHAAWQLLQQSLGQVASTYIAAAKVQRLFWSVLDEHVPRPEAQDNHKEASA